jgi:hypothetical protein
MVLSYSCQQRTTNNPSEILGKQVSLPENRQWIIQNRDTVVNLCQNNPKIVVYFDLKDCSMCQLKKLRDWNTIVDLINSEKGNNDSLNVDCIFILNVDKDEPKFRNKFNTLGFKYPVMCDVTATFAKSNLLHKNKLFNCFLLNQEQKIVVIGNPIYTDNLWERYKESIFHINQSIKHTQ